MKRLACFIMLLLLIGSAFAQERSNSISGFVTDKTTGKPLANVNILISGTAIGLVTGRDGYYEIDQLPAGDLKITFSLIGYESISALIKVKESSHVKYNAALSLRIYSTETVEISSERILSRARMMELFRRAFLGQTDRPDDLVIKNDSAVKITRINSQELSFSSDTNITILNNALGYRLDGVLKDFRYNQLTGEGRSSFNPHFTELKAQTYEQKTQWAKNRELVYRGSLKHFLRSLVKDRTAREGFELFIKSPDENEIKKVTDTKTVIGTVDSSWRVLYFDGLLVVKYGLDVSAIKLNEPYITISLSGETREESAFTLSGSFAFPAISEMLPEDYDPGKEKITIKKTGPPDIHEQIEAFTDTLRNYQGMAYNHVKDSLQALMFTYPENIIYRLKFAALLERCCIVSAEHTFEDIIELDSSCYEAYYRLGKIRADEYDEYRTSVRKMTDSKEVAEALVPDGPDKDNIPDPAYLLGSMKKVSTEMFTGAEGYFKKAVSLKADIDDYYMSLAFLYEDSGDYKKAISTLKEIAGRNPDDKYVHLFLGMLYFRISEYKNSHDEYNRAMSLMSADEKSSFMFSSVKKLLEPVLGKNYDKLDDISWVDLIRRFWRAEDPLLLTRYNERLLEHYSRVAYANLRFSNRKKTIPGWETERGEILLRYGYPKSVVRYRPYVDGTEAGLTTFAKTEVWYYDNMLFSFSDPFMTNKYELTEPAIGAFPVASQFETDSRGFVRRLKSHNIFEQYIFKPEGEAIKSSFKVYQFKNLSGKTTEKTDIYMSMSVPFNDSVKHKGYVYQWGFYCFDRRFNMLGGLSDSLKTLTGENSIVSNDGTGKYVLVHEFSESPAELTLAAEILREPDKGAFSVHEPVVSRDFRGDSLKLSDIILSSRVVFGSSRQSAINRNGIWILPDPANVFSAGDSVHIYYEVYNLAKNFSGINDYDQEITISRKDDEPSAFGKTVNGIINFFKTDKDNKPSALRTKLISYNKNHQLSFQTNFGMLGPGEYKFRVSLKDRVSGQTAEAETEFSVR